MNVGKMADGRWLRADVIPLRLASYIDVPRSLPILRSHYREKHVAYRSEQKTRKTLSFLIVEIATFINFTSLIYTLPAVLSNNGKAYH